MTVQEGTTYHFYSFSMDAGAPNGVNLYNGTYEDSKPADEADTELTWYDLPLSVQIACLQRLDPRE